jgi:ATP-dependent DNA ligase
MKRLMLGKVIAASILALASGCNQPSVAPTAPEGETAMSAAERHEAIKAGALRIREDAETRRKVGTKLSPGSAERKYLVNLFFSACPKASDWFQMQEAVGRGDVSVNLPASCKQLTPGAIIYAAPPGKRNTVSHLGHDYEEIRLGKVKMWTDSLDEIAARDLGPA